MNPEQFTRIAKALADPRRFCILERIAAEEEVACQCLRAEFPVAQPTMSHHLRELSVAGLIEPRREGQYLHYRLRADVLASYLRTLEERLRVAPAAAAADASA